MCKFLHDVNSETRALIKRSSRKGELKKKTLTIEEGKKWMLEFAGESIVVAELVERKRFSLESCFNE